MSDIENRMKLAVECGYWRGKADDPKLRDLLEAPCTRESIDAILSESTSAPRYPDEWYADKDNRMAGKPNGYLRKEGSIMVLMPCLVGGDA